MDEEIKRIIKEEIAPVVQLGRATLFLGAGFSIGTPTKKGTTIPSTTELIERILIESNNRDQDPHRVDLPLAFTIGQDEIKDFYGFLCDNFECEQPFKWQTLPFYHWWRNIYTTNIDTVIKECINALRKNRINNPDFKLFNYRDRQPVKNDILEPPIISLHGTIDDPQNGFIFDRVSYADYSVKGGDWINNAALSLEHGHCIIVGSRLLESDLEAELRKRKLWGKEEFTGPIWMVLRSFEPLEIKGYQKKGIIPIQAEASDFFEYLNEQLTILSPSKLLKKTHPHLTLETRDNPALSWFASAFEHIPTVISVKKSSKGIHSRFFTGDMPDWFYIANNVPARFDYIEELHNSILGFLSSTDDKSIFGMIITGPVASGKTTTSKLILKQLAVRFDSIYEYNSLEGINIEYAWSVLKNVKGPLFLFFDNSSEHFYAINEIAKRFMLQKIDTKVVFLIEERENNYQRNKHHLSILADKMVTFKVPNISGKNASTLLACLKREGMTGGLIEGKDDHNAAKIICDTEQGYRGDLLATLCDIASSKPFKTQLDEEFTEIRDEVAQEIFKSLSIVSSARLALPILYLAEIYRLEISTLIKILSTELDGKIYIHSGGDFISSRHPVIASYHLENFINYNDRERIILSLMECVSKKYRVVDIRKHPLPYRIYKSILSHHFLRQDIFPNDPGKIESIYSKCQGYFGDDGIFWLQYGRFLHEEGRLREAEHCLRKGLAIYDSFQIWQALGYLLVDLYIKERCSEDSLLEEGISLLKLEVASRGTIDPYPHTTLCNVLMNVMDRCPQQRLLDLLKETANEGMKYHKENDAFQGMIKRYMVSGYMKVR